MTSAATTTAPQPSRLAKVNPAGHGSLTLAGRRFKFTGFGRAADLSDVSLLFAKSGLVLGVREGGAGLRVVDPFVWLSRNRIKVADGGFVYEGELFEAESQSVLEASASTVPREWPAGTTLTWATRKRRHKLGVLTAPGGEIVGAISLHEQYTGWMDLPEEAYRTKKARERADARSVRITAAIAATVVLLPILILILKPSAAIFAFNGVAGGLSCVLLSIGGVIGYREAKAKRTFGFRRQLRLFGWALSTFFFLAGGLMLMAGGLLMSDISGVVVDKYRDTSGRSTTHYVTLDSGKWESSGHAYDSVEPGDMVDCRHTNPPFFDGSLYRCTVVQP